MSRHDLGENIPVLILWSWNGEGHHRSTTMKNVAGVKAWCCRKMPGHRNFRVIPHGKPYPKRKESGH